MKPISIVTAMALACAGAVSAQNATSSRILTWDDFTGTAQSTVNGVVSVKSYATPRAQRQMQSGSDFFSDPFFDFFFGNPYGQQNPRPIKDRRRHATNS